MDKKVTKIAELLPEGLSESAIEDIAELFNVILAEQVQEKVKLLEAKTHSFIRAQIDILKDQAQRELQLENKEYRNANLVESIKECFAFELTKDDEESAAGKMLTEQTQLTQENDLLVEELAQLTEQNKTSARLNKALSAQVKVLKREKEHLEEENKNLEASLGDFNTSERAVVVSEELGTHTSEVKETVKAGQDNEYLTEGVMALMPKKN